MRDKIKELIPDNLPIQGETFYNKILRQCHQKLKENDWEASSGALEVLQIVLDYLYDRLHLGEWHAVPVEFRRSFSIATIFKVIHLLEPQNDLKILEQCTYLLDLGIMLGEPLQNEAKVDILPRAAQLISQEISRLKETPESAPKRLKIDETPTESICDIPILDQPSLEHFLGHHYTPQRPVLLKNILYDWPAMEKWHNLDYLISIAGQRTVPVELGSQYTSENWGQTLMKLEDFIRGHVEREEKEERVAYLAQHDLFDQIPELKEDIRTPEYCTSEPRVKAWLGPKGTVSPLHTDPTHNLLCQVFGRKKIVLAAPEETKRLYPHEHFILSNTSQVDAEAVDLERFPDAKEVKFLHLTLERGDVLYLPPKWWHHVRSLSASFSVSFWFE